MKQFRQLQLSQRLVLTGANMSPQFLSGNCPDVNGAIINSYLGTVWEKLPRTNPARAQAQLLQKMIKRDVSNFDVDTGTALWAYKAAIEKGGFTRAAINTAIETKLKGFVTPGGKLRFSTDQPHGPESRQHVGRARSANCQPKPGLRRRVRSHQVTTARGVGPRASSVPRLSLETPQRCPKTTAQPWLRPGARERASAPVRATRSRPTAGRAEDQLRDRSAREGDPEGDQRARQALWSRRRCSTRRSACSAGKVGRCRTRSSHGGRT